MTKQSKVYVDLYSAYTLTDLECAREITCHIWDHTVLLATRQKWFSRLFPSVLLVLIYRPLKD